MTKKSDYEINKNGLKVLTREFLERRGYCCKSDCTNCPYNDDEKGDPSIPFELTTKEDSFEYEKYEELEKELFKTGENF